MSIASTGQEQSQDSSEDKRESENESESESESENESESESEAESTGEEAAGPGSTIDKQKPKKESPDSDESTEALEAKRDTSIDDRMEGIEVSRPCLFALAFISLILPDPFSTSYIHFQNCFLHEQSIINRIHFNEKKTQGG